MMARGSQRTRGSGRGAGPDDRGPCIEPARNGTDLKLAAVAFPNGLDASRDWRPACPPEFAERAEFAPA
jgi:hypothetical protein